jgi:hypothetical protein
MDACKPCLSVLFEGLLSTSGIFPRRPRSSNLQESQRLLSGCNHSCRAENHARWDLLQLRFEGSRKRFADEQGPGRSSGRAKTPLIRRRAEMACSTRVEQAPLVQLRAEAGRSGNAKSLLPQRLEETLMNVSLSDLSERRKTDRGEWCILKIVPPDSFDFSSFSGRQELCTDFQREIKELKCAIHDDTGLREELESQRSTASFAGAH